MRPLVLGALCFGLAGCGNLVDLPGSGAPPQIYSLTAPRNLVIEGAQYDWRLLVEEPDASRAIDTNRIVLRPSPVEIKYFARARWSDRAPRMIQGLLIQAFDNTDAIEAVGRGTAGMGADFLVSGYLSDFQMEYESGDPVVKIRLKLNIVEQKTGRIVATKTFQNDAALTRDRTRDVVLGFDSALSEMMTQAVAWVFDEVETHRR